MTFTDNITSQRSKSHSLELFQHEVHNKDHPFHQNPKLKKRFHMSVFDLLHWHRPADIVQSKNTQQQQQQTIPHRPSIIKPSDIARAISKKSVTFASSASVFDLPDNDHMNSELEPTLERDFVIVIENKRIDDETMIDSNESIEPYPFRSKIPLSPLSRSTLPIDISTTTSHHPRKNIVHHFIPHRHPKKLSHPIPTIDPVSTIHRSNSAPNMLFSSLPSAPPTALVNKNDQEQPSKTIGTWFKSLKLSRFVKSFGKQPRRNQKPNISKTRKRPSQQLLKLSKTSELVY